MKTNYLYSLNKGSQQKLKKITLVLSSNFTRSSDGITKSYIVKLLDIGEELQKITNSILEAEELPQELKIGKVTPIHKNGSVEDLKNYNQY